MSNLLRLQIYFIISLFFFHTTYEDGIYDEILLELSKNNDIKKYVYFYQNYNENFGKSLISLKNEIKSIRLFFYEYDRNSSLSFHSYNVYCRLINTDNKIVFFMQNFKLLIQVQINYYPGRSKLYFWNVRNSIKIGYLKSIKFYLSFRNFLLVWMKNIFFSYLKITWILINL